MKKILLFSAAVLFAAVTMAQTVCSSTLRMRYCFTTTINQDTTVGCNLPYMWHGKALSQTNIYKDTVKTGECDSIFIMNFTATDFTTKDTLAQVAVCGSDPYVWPGSGVYADSTIKKAGFYTRTFTSVKGCDSLVTLPAVAKICKPTGALDGLFSVSANKQVFFSQGNLLYRQGNGQVNFAHTTKDGCATLGRWAFTDHQYQYVGMSDPEYNESDIIMYDEMGANYKSQNMPSTFDSWVDLFRFGSSGVSTSTCDYPELMKWAQNDSYSYVYLPTTSIDNTNYDWGVYNAIYNGGNEVGMWRTLSEAEWNYLLFERTTPSVRYQIVSYVTGGSQSTTVHAIVIFPDDYNSSTAPAYPSSPSLSTLETWLNATHAVLLPAGYYRSVYKQNEPDNTRCYNDKTYYFTTTASETSGYFRALEMNLISGASTGYVSFVEMASRTTGALVRLVADVE